MQLAERLKESLRTVEEQQAELAAAIGSCKAGGNQVHPWLYLRRVGLITLSSITLGLAHHHMGRCDRKQQAAVAYLQH